MPHIRANSFPCVFVFLFLYRLESYGPSSAHIQVPSQHSRLVGGSPAYPPQHYQQQHPPVYAFFPQPAAFFPLPPPPQNHVQPGYYQQQSSGNWQQNISFQYYPYPQHQQQEQPQPAQAVYPRAPPRQPPQAVFGVGSSAPERRPQRDIVQRATRAGHAMSWGVVKFFRVDLGYGFIVDAHVFIHYTGIAQPSDFRCLSPGERVEYELVWQDGRWQALGLSGLNGVPLLGVSSEEQSATVRRNSPSSSSYNSSPSSPSPPSPPPESATNSASFRRCRERIVPTMPEGLSVVNGRVVRV
ncbi:hypothetical protein JCM8547_005349 [Rhodosporidiobolus lusitaniae]